MPPDRGVRRDWTVPRSHALRGNAVFAAPRQELRREGRTRSVRDGIPKQSLGTREFGRRRAPGCDNFVPGMERARVRSHPVLEGRASRHASECFSPNPTGRCADLDASGGCPVGGPRFGRSRLTDPARVMSDAPGAGRVSSAPSPAGGEAILPFELCRGRLWPGDRSRGREPDGLWNRAGPAVRLRPSLVGTLMDSSRRGVVKNPGGSPRNPSRRVFRSGSSPDGAETNQPRATPWGRFPTACKPWKGGTTESPHSKTVVSPFQGLALGWCPHPQGVALGWFVTAPFGAQKAQTEAITGFCQEISPDPVARESATSLGLAQPAPLKMRTTTGWRRPGDGTG